MLVVGDASYPAINMFSVCSVKVGNDVPVAWLPQHKSWALQSKSPWFAFALGRGSKENNLHVQGVMDCRIYATKADALRESLKLMLNVHPSGNAKIEVKACLAGQTATYVHGYIMKDKGKAHFHVSCWHKCILLVLLSNLLFGRPFGASCSSLDCYAHPCNMLYLTPNQQVKVPGLTQSHCTVH